LGIWDLVATVACISGVVIAYFADTQLHEFVTGNEKLKQLGEPTVPTLEDGLWGYSRHPNYFGEMMVQWGFFAMAVDTGLLGLATIVAPLALSYLIMGPMGANLLERRLGKKSADYQAYIRRTSPFVPWPPKAAAADPAAGERV
jgi:steroid 5-alpha reductase family enzyme